jgi:hypothetical protein
LCIVEPHRHIKREAGRHDRVNRWCDGKRDHPRQRVHREIRRFEDLQTVDRHPHCACDRLRNRPVTAQRKLERGCRAVARPDFNIGRRNRLVGRRRLVLDRIAESEPVQRPSPILEEFQQVGEIGEGFDSGRNRKAPARARPRAFRLSRPEASRTISTCRSGPPLAPKASRAGKTTS